VTHEQQHGPQSLLRAGCDILDPVLKPLGFRFTPENAGMGSGGPFASGTYSRGDRSLELHFRHSLGLVNYHIGDSALDHETYMRLLGVRDKCSYPDFPKMPLDSFRSLANDLKQYCSDFLTGAGDQFHHLSISSKTEKRGFERLL
jgi:hypothetical protein